MSAQGLPSTHEKELDLLRSSFRRRILAVSLKVAAAVSGLLMVSIFIALLFIDAGEDSLTYPRTVAELEGTSAPWGRELLSSIASYHSWLGTHGTQMELSLFEKTATKIGTAAISTAGTNPEELGWFSSLCLSLYAGALRIFFIVIASFRLWLVVVLCFVAYGLTFYEPYAGADVLGQSGNGRVFYSGIRAGLDKVSASGAPDMQLRGLACPQYASSAEAKASPLWRVITEYGAATATNEVLTAIIVKNGNVAAYVPIAGEEEALDACFTGSTIAENTPHLLNAALDLHRSYAANERIEDGATLTASDGEQQKRLSAPQYSTLVQSALHRVLTAEMRRCIGKFPPEEIATAVLALEAGKVLAYAADGDRWTRKSNFVHLNARAVLHSLLEYPADYSFESRTTLRRALIYASRRSAFAPVRMPLDMTKEEWALRQWAEVLLALPHELSAVAEEVELAGLIREGHDAWTHEFFDKSILVSPTITSVSFVTPYGLLFVPFAPLFAVLSKTLPASQQQRLHELASVVSRRQSQILEKAQASEGGLPTFDRVLPPLSKAEIETLSALHGLDREALSAWSALRLILNGYSWLGRRVGDYTVPDSSVIFAVLNPDRPMEGVNALGLLGKTGMVPLRGSKLLERLGPSWNARFVTINGATMAETPEDFEKLMRGIKERDEGFDVVSEPGVGA